MVLLGLRGDILSLESLSPRGGQLFRPRRPCIRNPYSCSAREWVAYLSQGVTRPVGARGMAWHRKVNPNRAYHFAVNYWEIIADNLSKAGWSWGYV
jgi:hypothetical protein